MMFFEELLIEILTDFAFLEQKNYVAEIKREGHCGTMISYKNQDIGISIDIRKGRNDVGFDITLQRNRFFSFKNFDLKNYYELFPYKIPDFDYEFYYKYNYYRQFKHLSPQEVYELKYNADFMQRCLMPVVEGKLWITDLQNTNPIALCNNSIFVKKDVILELWRKTECLRNWGCGIHLESIQTVNSQTFPTLIFVYAQHNRKILIHSQENGHFFIQISRTKCCLFKKKIDIFNINDKYQCFDADMKNREHYPLEQQLAFIRNYLDVIMHGAWIDVFAYNSRTIRKRRLLEISRSFQFLHEYGFFYHGTWTYMKCIKGVNKEFRRFEYSKFAFNTDLQHHLHINIFIDISLGIRENFHIEIQRLFKEGYKIFDISDYCSYLDSGNIQENNKNSLNDQISFLKNYLMPVIRGEMWIDELIKLKEKERACGQ